MARSGLVFQFLQCLQALAFKDAMVIDEYQYFC